MNIETIIIEISDLIFLSFLLYQFYYFRKFHYKCLNIPDKILSVQYFKVFIYIIRKVKITLPCLPLFIFFDVLIEQTVICTTQVECLLIRMKL